MLVLSRKKDEKIVIGDQITLLVIDIRGDKVRLGIEAPKDISIHRHEIYDAIQKEKQQDTAKQDDTDDTPDSVLDPSDVIIE